MSGLSRPNLYSMKRFHEFYAIDGNQFKIVSQAVTQLDYAMKRMQKILLLSNFKVNLSEIRIAMKP